MALFVVFSIRLAMDRNPAARMSVGDEIILPREPAADARPPLSAKSGDVGKTTMPLDGLREMFDYASSGDDDWGNNTSIIGPPPHGDTSPAPISQSRPTSSPAPTGIESTGAAGDQAPIGEHMSGAGGELGVLAFDGWSGAASYT